MADRKTVIKGVECCSRPNNTNLCGECPYNKNETRFGCMHRLITDVFAMLKEQEPVKPTFKQDESGINCWCCGSCGAYMYHIYDGIDKAKEYSKYCRQCGKQVKWE